MSSHREAPEISKDPVADSTDVYAFVSPDQPDTVTLIANYIPLQGPAGGPNFYEFGDDVLYEIHVDNNGDGQADVTFQFRFRTTVRNPDTFLYNTGPIPSLTSPNWNRRQSYAVTRCHGQRHGTPRHGPGLPAVQHRPAVHAGLPARWPTPRCTSCPAGSRCSPASAPRASTSTSARSSTWLDLRPFAEPARPVRPALASRPRPASTPPPPERALDRDPGADRAALTGERPPDVIGVWTTASRQRVRLLGRRQRPERRTAARSRQVSRLGNPLVNEVLIPLGQKDQWNRCRRPTTSRSPATSPTPSWPRCCPRSTRACSRTWPRWSPAGKPRADLEAILLTGIPTGIIPGFQNFTGPVQADMLRLNTAIPPTTSPSRTSSGWSAVTSAGFPNGRRVFDDVVTIELRAIAGVTYPLVDTTFTPDAAAGQLTDGLTPASVSDPLPEPVPLPRGALRRLHQPIKPRAHSGTSGPGTVVLELGAGVGALILYAPAGLDGHEIEISPGRARRAPTRWCGRGTCPGRPGTRRSTRACRPGATPSGGRTPRWPPSR